MKQKLQQIRIFRYAFGITIAMAVAQGFGWTLSYLVPVLLLGFLAPPALPLSFKEGMKFILVIVIAVFFGLLFDNLVSFPLVFVPMMFLVFLLLFYAKESVIPPGLRTWILIAVVLIPMMALTSQNLSILVANILVLDAVVAVLIAWVVYAIVPNPKGSETYIDAAAKKQIQPLSEKERFANALETTAVFYPVLLLFFLFQLTDYLIILIFIVILSGMPAASKSFKVGKVLIIGNLFGGLASIVFYNIMTFVPEYYYLLLVTFLAGLLFGFKVMSGKPIGAVFGMAFSTFLVISGSVFASTDDAAGLVWSRVFYIFIAALYVVFAFGFIEQWKKYLKDKKANKKLVKQLKVKRV